MNRNLKRTSYGSARDHDESFQYSRNSKATSKVSDSRGSQERQVPFKTLSSNTGSQNSRGSTARSVGRGILATIIAACAWLWNKSKVASLVLAALLVVAIGTGVDSLANLNRIYPGVSVGNIDLSGKTINEAIELIANEYEPHFLSNDVVLCANESVAQDERSGVRVDSLEEQVSYEESLSNRTTWTLDSQHLHTGFYPEDIAMSAYQVGRDDGWIFSRIGSQLFGTTIEPACRFDPIALEDLRDEIIKALGSKMENCNVWMNGNDPEISEGHDGYEVSSEWLMDKLNEGFLSEEGRSIYVIDMQTVPIQIDQAKAQRCANEITASISKGINFKYEDSEWFADQSELAKWIRTSVEPDGGSYRLKPYFDIDSATSAILNGFGFSFEGSDYVVQFSNNNGSIEVQTNATGSVPYASSALESLNASFFSDREKGSVEVIDIESQPVPDTMSFEDALDYGLVVEISSYTTRYVSGVEARNHNIHLAADTLNNSICKAGETWSFIALAGDTTEAQGYQSAGAILNGEYTDDIGGGVCQVATTVYNAVYDAGFPIVERHNHSLFIASYPEGRDAAIAYPDLDLIWENDTNSDVLLVMSYTNSSVTATLYGTDPGYVVETTYGEWQEGEPYKTTYRQDSTIPAGKEVVESNGSDGRYITIIRTVKDRDGNTISEKEFHSNYSPKNKVIVLGTDSTSSDEE